LSDPTLACVPEPGALFREGAALHPSDLEPHRSPWPLVIGLALSCCAHLAAASVLATASANPDAGADLQRLRPPQDDRVRLGVERSDANTITWLGFEDPTPHDAPQAELEQAALEIARARRVAEQLQRAAASAPKTIADIAGARSEQTREQTPVAPAGVDLPESPPRSADIVAAPESPQPQSPGEAALQREQTGQEPPAESAQADQGRPVPQQPDAQPGQGESGEADAADNAAPTPDDENTGAAEKDASARALKKPVKVDPGRPVAAEGLDIRTVRPKWSHTTLLTSRPRSPVIRVYFNRQGKVDRAVFERNTGNRFVDQPLMNAVYAWTARGEALNDLAKEENESTLEIIFEISLR